MGVEVALQLKKMSGFIPVTFPFPKGKRTGFVGMAQPLSVTGPRTAKESNKL